MKQFNLKLTNVGNASPSILIDGKPIKVKKNAFGNIEYSCQTEKDSVNVVIKDIWNLEVDIGFGWELCF